MIESGTIGFGVILVFVVGYALYHFFLKKDKDVSNTGTGGKDGSNKRVK